jgi:glutathione peroxidase
MSPATLLLALSLFFSFQPESPAPPKAPEPKPAEIKPADAKPQTKPESTPPAQAEPAKPADPYVLGHTLPDIDGKDQKLEQYKGKVVLIVNVASKCGLTPQYKNLQKLFDEKKDKGLVILGFPANNFAGQEPGKDADIKAFCEKSFGVTFPMFAKVSVKGDDQHALFKQLAGQPKPLGGDPTWNFTKFLVNREGKVVARFEPRTDPADTTFVKKIDELLAEGQPAAKPAEPAPAEKK